MLRLYSSRREAQLWLWLVLVMAGIYATLGQAPSLAGVLRERGDLQTSLYLVLFISLVAVAVLFVRRRPNRAEIGVAAGVIIVYIAAWMRIGTLEERTHLFEYGLVAALVHEALLERRANGYPVPTLPLLALGISILLGWVDEGIQALLPNRVYDLRDVVFNGLAATMIIGARWLLEVVRRRAGRR